MSLNKSKELREIAKIKCRELREDSTKAEDIIWDRVRNRKFMRKKFYRQYPIFFDSLGKENFYIADFYCHENKLVIELDGNFHKFQIKKDNLRTEIIEEKGIKVLRFMNDEIEKNMDKALCVLEKILTHS